MSRAFTLDLAALRQIGWDHWDPIGIRGINLDAWQGAAADEYDRYMLHVAQLLKNGASQEQAIAYLDEIVSDHMGIGPITTERHIASVRTVEAISEYQENTRSLSER